MKKHIVVAAGLAVLSTGAFATVARMQALNQGTGAQGSYYIDDERNVFRSAGAFSGNYVYMEHGADFAAGATTGTAEGGVFREGGSMSYGLYLNSTAHGDNVQTSGANGVDPGRLDLFLKGNSGMNWGVRLGYSSILVDASNIDNSGFDFSVSAELGGADVWLTMEPGADKTTAAQNDQAADMQLGASMEMNDHTLFAEYDSQGGNDGADAQTTLTLGAAQTHSTDSGMWFYDVSLVNVTNQGFNTDNSQMSLPVTFGFETKATSWLTWRGSLQQSLYGAQTTGDNDTSVRTTSIGVGASLTWGSLRVDGTVNSSTGNNLGTNNFMSGVSAVYNF